MIVGFVVGLVVGGFLGSLPIALCVSAAERRADDPDCWHGWV